MSESYEFAVPVEDKETSYVERTIAIFDHNSSLGAERLSVSAAIAARRSASGQHGSLNRLIAATPGEYRQYLFLLLGAITASDLTADYNRQGERFLRFTRYGSLCKSLGNELYFVRCSRELVCDNIKALELNKRTVPSMAALKRLLKAQKPVNA